MNICMRCKAVLEEGQRCTCINSIPETQQCPWCKSEIPKEASRCRYCQKDTNVLADFGKSMTMGCTVPVLCLLAILFLLGYCGSAKSTERAVPSRTLQP